MKKLSNSKIDLTLTMLIFLPISLSIIVIFFSAELMAFIAIEVSPAWLFIFSAAYLTIFNLFAKKSDKIDTLSEDLSPIASKRKGIKEGKLGTIKRVITKHQKESLSFFAVVLFIAFSTYAVKPLYGEVIIFLAVVWLLFNLVAHFRVYFQIDNLVAITSVEIKEFITANNNRTVLLDTLESDSQKAPITNDEQLKGYLKIHTH